MLEQNISDALEKAYGPIETTFTITSIPEGGAPLDIRREWVGVSLPLRKLHAVRLLQGYIGRRSHPVPEDRAPDVITGEKPEWPLWGSVEIRGYDAVNSLNEMGRTAAARYWQDYNDAMLCFHMYEGRMGDAPSVS